MNWIITKTDPRDIARLVAHGSVDTCGHEPLIVAKLELDGFCRSELDGDGQAMCRACADASRDEEEKELVFCRDCRRRKPRSQVREWRWFDFYAPQGDEPLDICTDCWKQPTHQRRLKKDNDERLREEQDDDKWPDYDGIDDRDDEDAL